DRRTSEALERYSWPGNIRELQNVIERGVILADSEVFRLEPGTLPAESKGTDEVAGSESQNTRDPEKARIEAVLKETHGRGERPDGVAARLGMAVSAVASRIRAQKIHTHLL